MTSRAVFASLVDGIFGSGSTTFDTAVAQSNNVIGALAHPTDFTAFKKNFEARLHRLNTAVQKSSPRLTELRTPAGTAHTQSYPLSTTFWPSRRLVQEWFCSIERCPRAIHSRPRWE
jgi:hypothetical protein